MTSSMLSKQAGHDRPYPTFEDGLRYMKVVQAVADSRARNEWITIHVIRQ